jgi:hypothetical protein
MSPVEERRALSAAATAREELVAFAFLVVFIGVLFLIVRPW